MIMMATRMVVSKFLILNIIISNVLACPLIFNDNEICLKNLNDEIDQYDHQLGKWLYRYQSDQWQRLIGRPSEMNGHYHQESSESAISDFIHWSSDRYQTYCNSSITSIEFDCRLDKFCRYWSDVQRLFGDGNDHRQSSNDIQFEFNHQKQTLTHQIEQIGIVYRGHHRRCDESIDLLMEKLQNSDEILKIWQECHQQLEYHMIPDLFKKIRKQISGKYFYGKFLFCKKNSKLMKTFFSCVNRIME